MVAYQVFRFYLYFVVVAKLFYRYEALGRGDYWLMLGLGSFISWTRLPLLIFLACLTGLIYVVFNARDKKTFIPFARSYVSQPLSYTCLIF